MTYRDDHDAALQRAAALEAELARAKSERDAAVKERDRLATKLEAEKPLVEQRIVIATKPALTSAERDHLVDLLERGAKAERAGGWFAASLGAVFGVLGIIACFVESAQVAVSGIFLGLLLGGLSTARLVTTTRDRWQPVLDAVRDDPSKVSIVKRRGNRRGWSITVETRQAELSMPGNNDTLRLLERHCPGARFDFDD